MPTETVSAAIGVAVILAVSGCTGAGGGLASTGPAFGESVRQTLAAQVVDPVPVYDGPMLASGNKAARAILRYETDQVKQPDRTSTSNLATGGSSGGGR
jgi:hypothetical protein